MSINTAEYYELALKATGEEAEILIARLGDVGFDTFLEEEDMLKAYLPAHLVQDSEIEILLAELKALPGVYLHFTKIEAQNWNQTWEDNFQPVVIAGRLQIRARHHEPDLTAPLQLVIEPKMSFGTGHHATTSQVAALQLDIDHVGKTILDAGSGTGILAILAEKLGANRVFAFDHETWATENARENAALNSCTALTITQDDLATYQPLALADGMLANITRNLVIENMPNFAQWLKPGGWLITSGYYEEDLPAVTTAAEMAGFRYAKHTVQDRWCAARFNLAA